MSQNRISTILQYTEKSNNQTRIQVRGTLAGKNLLTYASKCDNCSYADFNKELRKYKLCEALRVIGIISSTFMYSSEKAEFKMMQGIPVSEAILSYIA